MGRVWAFVQQFPSSRSVGAPEPAGIPELILNLGRDLPIGREVARQLSGSGSVELASFEEVVQTLKKVVPWRPWRQWVASEGRVVSNPSRSTLFRSPLNSE